MLREAYEEGRRRWAPVELPWADFERSAHAILAGPDASTVARPALADLYIALSVAADLPGARDRFVRHYHPYIRRIARACTSSGPDADDVEGMSLERVCLRLGQFKGLCSLEGFLATLVRNIARDLYKARKAEQRKVQALQREQGYAVPDEDGTTARATQPVRRLENRVESALEDDDCLDLFRLLIPRALACLPDDQKLVVQLVLMDDVPSKEVATVLHVHESGITRRKQKALTRLQPALLQAVRELPGGSDQDLYDCL